MSRCRRGVWGTEKLIGKLKDFIAKVKAYFDGLTTNTKAEAALLKEMRDGGLHYLERIVEAYDKAATSAVENYQGAETRSEGKAQRDQLEIREAFADEIEQWAKDGKPEGVRFTLGSTGPVLQGLGAIESDIYMEGDKISTILQDHPEMTLAEIKKIPQILEDPALVLKSKNRGGTSNTRLVLLDTAKAKNGRNIVAVLDLRPVEKGFAIDDIQKVSSAYTKTATENRTAKENSRDFLKTSDVLFLDKKRATSLLKTMGFYMPIELHRNGYVGSISYFKQNVNIKGVPFSSVVREGDVQLAIRDSEGRILTEAQQDYFKDSKVRDADGNLLVMYHQTDGTFTVFDTKHKGAGAGDDETPFGIFLKRTSRNIGVRGEKQMELYADIRNPLRVRDRTELVSKLRELSVDYARLKDESAQIDKEYGAKFEEAKNAFKSFLIQWRKNNPDAPPRAAYDADGFDAAFNAEDNVVKEWTHAKDELALRAKTSITQALRDNGYDGVFLENDKGSWGRSTDAYIALDANQVKNTTNKSPTADPDIRYSIREIAGKVMPVLDTQKDTRNYSVAEAYLKTLVDTEHPFSTILMDAQPVYIGRDLPGEYRGSEYTKGMEAKLRLVKMQAATNLDEMLLLAENGEWRKNIKKKHKVDAKNGWYRYSTQFAVPVLDIKKSVDHYTVYSGTLLIRNDADGKSYLYDLLDIKKEKVISSASFSARGHSEVFEPKPSQTQYTQD